MSKSHEWKSVLAYSDAVFSEIEKGTLKWGDSYADCELFLKPIQVTAGGNYNRVDRNFRGGAPQVKDKDWYCAKYQSKDCALSGSHNHFFYKDNVIRKVEHFCSICWVTEGAKKQHPAIECPSKK